MSFIGELKRRNVIRMAGLYLVGAWLVTQVGSTVLPAFNAPAWMVRALIIALAAGFVPVLAFAWIFEWTPEGLKRDADIPEEQSIAPQTGRRMERGILALLAVALAFFAFDKFVMVPKREAALVAAAERSVRAKPPAPAASAANAKSIAVLPFVDMSKAGDQEYFSDGLAETTLDMLSRAPGLKVMSRTSSFAFKGRAVDVREIGEKLGVAHILEGSVQQSGDVLRITAQLVRTSDGAHLWSKQYDRKMADIFKIQDEVATEVVKAIQGALPADGAERMLGQGTGTVAAYQEYLKGIALLPERTVDGLRRAVVHFERAIAIDPAYARAHAMAGIALQLLGEYTVDSPERVSRRERYIERALELSPELGEAHIARANRLSAIGDYAGAEAAYRRGIALAPSYSSGYQWFGEFLFFIAGKPPQGLQMLERALALDPLSPVVRMTYYGVLADVGRLDEAVAGNRAVLAENPGLPLAIRQQARLYQQRGDLVQALRAYDQAIANEPSEPTRAGRCRVLLEFGAIADARRCEAGLGSAGRISGNRKSLQIELKMAEGDFPAALSLVESAGPEALWARAQILQVNGRYAEALAIFRKLVPELLAEPPAADAIQFPGDPAMVATALIGTGAHKQAHTLLRMGIKAAADRPHQGAYGKGWWQVYDYGLLGEFDNACQALAEAADQGYFLDHLLLVQGPALARLRQQPCFEKNYARIRVMAETQVEAARRAGLLP